jgi:hypothetical protein
MINFNNMNHIGQTTQIHILCPICHVYSINVFDFLKS